MKIVVGGQYNKQEIAEAVKKAGGDAVEVQVKTDLDAAMMVKNGQAAIYIGACQTGGGGSLAMPIALLGAPKCLTVAMAGKIMDKNDIEAAVSNGVIAFGMVPQAIGACVPAIVGAVLLKYGDA